MSDKPLLIAAPFPQVWSRLFSKGDRNRLNELVSVKYLGDDPVPDKEIDALIPDAVAIAGQPDLPQARLERAQKLKVIFGIEGNFYQNIDYDYCFRNGIRVLNCGPVYGLPVAEMALEFALNVARGVHREDRRFRAGTERYLAEACGDSILLSGAEVGFIGFGNLGRALRPLLEPFRCRIKVYDPWLPDSLIYEHGCQPAGLDEVLSTSTFIFVLAGVTTENQGFLGARQFDLIRPGSIFLLMSRAAVIDFDEFVKRVAAGQFKAATDVFPQEPMPKDHPVRDVDELLLSPHRAGGIPYAFHSIGQMLVDDLDLILRGLPPIRMQVAQPETVERFSSKPADQVIGK
jgi:phosphoglycerate dehydrogenase-like enzyme